MLRKGPSRLMPCFASYSSFIVPSPLFITHASVAAIAVPRSSFLIPRCPPPISPTGAPPCLGRGGLPPTCNPYRA